METLKIILAFIGACTVIMTAGGWLLYLCFYRSVTLEELEEEEEYERENLFIDELLEQ